MTNLIINASVGIFALCALFLVLNQRIEKRVASWIFLIGIIISASSMLANQHFYDVSFAFFAFFAACAAVHGTILIWRVGRL